MDLSDNVPQKLKRDKNKFSRKAIQRTAGRNPSKDINVRIQNNLAFNLIQKDLHCYKRINDSSIFRVRPKSAESLEENAVEKIFVYVFICVSFPPYRCLHA
jgi:hypothetical protein